MFKYFLKGMTKSYLMIDVGGALARLMQMLLGMIWTIMMSYVFRKVWPNIPKTLKCKSVRLWLTPQKATLHSQPKFTQRRQALNMESGCKTFIFCLVGAHWIWSYKSFWNISTGFIVEGEVLKCKSALIILFGPLQSIISSCEVLEQQLSSSFLVHTMNSTYNVHLTALHYLDHLLCIICLLHAI